MNDTTPSDRKSQIATTVVAGLSAMMMTLDTTVVNVALDAIGTEFSATLSQLQWIINGYTLAFAALLLSAGSLADRLGRRGIFVSGVAIFTLASAACPFSPTPEWLITARIVQGLGAALVMGTGLALIAGAYEGEDPKKRQTAIGIFSALGAAAAAFGPLIGGALVDSGGWRLIFLINIPVGLVIIALTLTMVERQRRTLGERLDLLGAVIAVLLLFSLNYGLLTGAAQGWARRDVIATLSAAAVLLLSFVAVERRLGKDAMFDLSLFRIPTFSAAIVLSLAARLCSFGLYPFLILWLTGILGHTPLQVGLILLILSAAMIIVAPFSGVLTKWASVRGLCALGMGVTALGLFASAWLIGPDSGWNALLPALVLIGLGGGLVVPHMMGLAVSVVPAERAGMASGMSNSFFPIGTALGVAAYGAVMTAIIGANIADPAAAAAVAAGRLSEAAAHLPAGGEGFITTAKTAFVSGLSTTLFIAGVASLIAAVAVFFLIRDSDVVDKPKAAS